MMFGIIYEYCDAMTGKSAYIGKAAGLYGHAKTLEVVHRRHLTGRTPVPFDFILRAGEQEFSLRVIDAVIAGTAAALQVVLKPLEKARVRERHPSANHVKFTLSGDAYHQAQF